MSTNEKTPVKNVSKVSKNATSNKKHKNERAHQLKIYAVGSVLILLAIILLANVLLDKVLGNALTFDFSVQNSNVISDASVQFLDSLPQDAKIRIVGLFERPSSFYETKYQYIVPLLDDYQKKSNGKVTVEYVDITKNPGIIQQLDPTNSYNLKTLTGWYVVSYNGKLDVIDPISCYTIDTDMLNETNSFIATGINSEYTFTNSMMSLVKGFTNKAYFVTGLKENGSTQFKRLLNGMGVISGTHRNIDLAGIRIDLLSLIVFISNALCSRITCNEDCICSVVAVQSGSQGQRSGESDMHLLFGRKFRKHISYISLGIIDLGIQHI